VLLVLATGGCRRPAYPAGATIQFEMQCDQRLWPGGAPAPLDLREAYCRCLLERSQRRYALDEFDRIRIALDRGGYRLDAPGVPASFRALAAECQAALDRGGSPVR
jgi:hypothetical protein